MKLRYFGVDRVGRLTIVRRGWVEALWQGRRRAADLGCGEASELKLVSVLCDDRLQPQKVYLLRLPLSDGIFTRRNYRMLRSYTMPSRVTAKELLEHHTTGWPRDFFPQLAVALDVPSAYLDVPMGIGGPLMLAAALRVPPKQAARYLQ